MSTQRREKQQRRSGAQQVSNALRSGATVIIYQDDDEMLALAEVKAGCSAIAPVRVISAVQTDPTQGDALALIDDHTQGKGTLIVCDLLAIYGQNPVAVRTVRQMALQDRADGVYSRLILVERPSTDIPKALQGDVEVIEAKLPSVEELQDELDSFITLQPKIMPEGNGEARFAIAAAGAGIARHEFSRLLARSVIENGVLDPVWIRREKAARVAQKLGGALTFENADAADVGGYGALLDYLQMVRLAFASKAAQQYGLPNPKGVMLVGVPGGGKSLTAKLIARVWGLPLIRFDIGKVFGSLVGQSESNTRNAIQAIEACAPCVCWIDELEKAVAGMSSGSSTDGGTTQRTGGTLLTWLQEKTSAVYVVATVNRFDALPPELPRKGRFDEVFAVGLPSPEEREQIVRIHLARRNRDLGDDAAARIAQATDGFVGAELEQAIIDAMFMAFSQEGRDITVDDILAAAARTVPMSRTAKENINRINEWVQSGRCRNASGSDSVGTATAGQDGEPVTFYSPRRPRA